METTYKLEIIRSASGEVSIKGSGTGVEFTGAEIVGYLEFVKQGIILKNVSDLNLKVVA